MCNRLEHREHKRDKGRRCSRLVWPLGDRKKVGLTRLHGPIRVKRSGSVKGVEDGQGRQTLLA